MWSSTPPPSISTARAAALPGSSSPTRNGWTEHLQDYYRHTGPAMSPFTAWTLIKGLETLPIRVKQQTENATRIADFLAEQGKIAKVIYPGRKDHPQADIIAKQMTGGSTLVAFEMKGGKDAAFKLQNALEVVTISNNLGDTRSIITHPATTTHKNLTDEARAELGISPGTVRFSAGIEDVDDLLEDFAQALAKVSA
jgi:O-succinylhomoserine sulfhydrylase